MGRITSNVDEEVITRIDTLAAAEGLSRSEWIARAVIDRLAVCLLYTSPSPRDS